MKPAGNAASVWTVAARVAVALAVVLATGGCVSDAASQGTAGDEVVEEVGSAPAPRVLQPGAPGEPNRELTSVPTGAVESESGSGAGAAADVRFMQQMYPHHRQALEMTALVADRTERTDLPLLARRMEISQEGELELIERWLTSRGETVPDLEHLSHHAVDGHDAGSMAGMPMVGMLTPDELDALERASGAEFDHLFVTSMIRHHEGALSMVADLFEQGGGLELEMLRFANDVDADQRIEIARMRSILAALEAG